MARAVTICLLIVGLINFVPVAGVLGAQSLEGAYAIALSSSDLQILMRHRALLFGILGGFILYSAFVPAYQTAAMLMGGVSMVGFAVLVLSTGGYNDAVGRVLTVDMVGIVLLVAAGIFKYRSARG